MESVEELRNRLQEIRDELPNLRSDVALEQVDYNNQMDIIIQELSEYQEIVYFILKQRVLNMLPTEPSPAIDEIYKESENYRNIIKMLGKDQEFVERFGFDRTIYEIGHGESVDRVNIILKEFYVDMSKIGIRLEYINFNYSTYTVRYMEEFFRNMDSEDFLITMKKCFDQIYWECPLLLTHLELCVRNLVTNNKKIIVRHINHILNKSLINAKSTKEDIIDKYIRTKLQYESLYFNDPFNMVDYFRNNPAEIDKFICPSPAFDQMLSTVTDTNYFYALDEENQNLLLKYVYDLYNDVREYEKVQKFSKLFDFVIGIYNNKESLKGTYKAKLKEIAKLEKEKNKLDRKVTALMRKRSRLPEVNVIKIGEINSQIGVINAELSKKIENIKMELDEANKIQFNETLSTLLNPATSLYEVVVFLSKYYTVLSDQIATDKKLDAQSVSDLVDEFRHIQYLTHLTVMKSTSFLDYANIKGLIEKKYTLYNIRVTIPAVTSADYQSLLYELKSLIRYSDLLRVNITPQDIKVFLAVEDLINNEVIPEKVEENKEVVVVESTEETTETEPQEEVEADDQEDTEIVEETEEKKEEPEKKTRAKRTKKNES